MGNKYFKKGKGGVGGGDGQNKKATPKKSNGGKPKPFKVHSLVVSKKLLSGPLHPRKVKYSDSNQTINVSIHAGISGPAHPPKQTGELSNNTFACGALQGNGNEELNNCNKKYKVYTEIDSNGKTEIITDITCKIDGQHLVM